MPHLVGHTTRCAISSSQVTLLEFAGTRWSSRRRFGLQSTCLALLSSQQHHAPCTTHHAPRTMHHAPCTMHHAPLHSALHRARCATHRWHISPCARHCALCTTHPSAHHILDGAVHCTPFTMHHHHASSQSSPGHRYTVLVCMSGTMPYPNGMIARACA